MQLSHIEALKSMPIAHIGLPPDVPAKRYVAQVGRSDRFGVRQVGLAHEMADGGRVEVGVILAAPEGLNPMEERLVEQVLLTSTGEGIGGQELDVRVRDVLAQPRATMAGQLDRESLIWSTLRVEDVCVGLTLTGEKGYWRYIIARGIDPSKVTLVTLLDLAAYLP